MNWQVASGNASSQTPILPSCATADNSVNVLDVASSKGLYTQGFYNCQGRRNQRGAQCHVAQAGVGCKPQSQWHPRGCLLLSGLRSLQNSLQNNLASL